MFWVSHNTKWAKSTALFTGQLCGYFQLRSWSVRLSKMVPFKDHSSTSWCLIDLIISLSKTYRLNFGSGVVRLLKGKLINNENTLYHCFCMRRDWTNLTTNLHCCIMDWCLIMQLCQDLEKVVFEVKLKLNLQQ